MKKQILDELCATTGWHCDHAQRGAGVRGDRSDGGGGIVVAANGPHWYVAGIAGGVVGDPQYESSRVALAEAINAKAGARG